MKSIVIAITLAVISMTGVSYADCGCGHCQKGGEQPAMRHGQRGNMHRHHQRRGHQHQGWQKRQHDAQPAQKPEGNARPHGAIQAPKAGCHQGQRKHLGVQHRQVWGKPAIKNAGKPAWQRHGQGKHQFHKAGQKHFKFSFGPKGHRHGAVRHQAKFGQKAGWHKGPRKQLQFNCGCKATRHHARPHRPMHFGKKGVMNRHHFGAKRVRKH